MSLKQKQSKACNAEYSDIIPAQKHLTSGQCEYSTLITESQKIVLEGTSKGYLVQHFISQQD